MKHINFNAFGNGLLRSNHCLCITGKLFHPIEVPGKQLYTRTILTVVVSIQLSQLITYGTVYPIAC